MAIRKKDEKLRIWLNKKGIYTKEVWKNDDIGRVKNKISTYADCLVKHLDDPQICL